MFRPRRLLASAAAVALLAALPSAADAAKARTSATQECPIFTVVVDDPQAGFPAGKYHRLNFSPNIKSLTCDDTYHIFRSYLYHPRSMRGWTAGKLIGEMRGDTGKRFTKNGSRGRIGFDVWMGPAKRGRS